MRITPQITFASLLIVAVLLISAPARAVIKKWDGYSTVSPDCSTGGNPANNAWGTGSTAATSSWCPNGTPTIADDVVLDNTYIEIPATAAVNQFALRSLTFSDNFNSLNSFTIQNNLASGRTMPIGNSNNPVQPMIQLNTSSGNVLFKRVGNGGNNLTLALQTSGVIDVVNAGVTLEIEAVLTGAGLGLTKTGAGTLVLSGVHTYSGGTTLSNGTLKVYTVFNGGGPFLAADGTTFEVRATDTSTALKTSALTLGDSAGLIWNLDLVGSGSRTVPLVQATNLTTGGTITLNIQGTGFIAGQQVPLISHSGTISGAGFGAFALGNLPSHCRLVAGMRTALLEERLMKAAER